MTATAERRAPVAKGLALASVCLVLFLTFLDNTIVSVALADMQTSLKAGVSSLQWIVDGYMLAFAALMLTGGTLGDILGRKKLLLGGVALFCGGGLVSALASTTTILIVGRVIMGVGAAASEPGTLSIIRHLYPDGRQRARALGIWTAVSGISLAVGPVLGGVLVGFAGWRGIFWFNVGLGLIALAASAWTLEESADPEGRSIDIPGLVAGAVAVLALTFAVIEGESAGFTTWWILLLFGVAAASLVAFVVVELRSPDPVLRLDYFRIPTFSAANLVAFATSFGLFAVFFFTALYLQIVSKFSGWKIALQFSAMAVAVIVAGLIAGRWTASRGPRMPMIVGCLASGGGILIVDALLKPSVSVGALAAALALVGFGLGLALVAVTSAVLSIVPAERSGNGRFDTEHEPSARRRSRGRDPRSGGQRAARERARSEADGNRRSRLLPGRDHPRRHGRRAARKRRLRLPRRARSPPQRPRRTRASWTRCSPRPPRRSATGSTVALVIAAVILLVGAAVSLVAGRADEAPA